MNNFTEEPGSGEDEESDAADGDDGEASAREPDPSSSESDEVEELSTSGRLGDLLNRANGELGDGVRTVPVPTTGTSFINSKPTATTIGNDSYSKQSATTVTYSTGGAITGEYLAERLGRQDPIQYKIFIAIISMFTLHTSRKWVSFGASATVQ